MEETVMKFDKGNSSSSLGWEIVENYETMDGRLYFDGVCDEGDWETKPCKHATNLREERQWEDELDGQKRVGTFIFWTIPRAVRAWEEIDHYHRTVTCLDCILEGVSVCYG